MVLPRPATRILPDFPPRDDLSYMRQAGTLATRQDADRFANYLLSLGITSKIEGSADQWAVWIHDENQLERSEGRLAQFRAEPNDPRYEQAERTAHKAAARWPKRNGWPDALREHAQRVGQSLAAPAGDAGDDRLQRRAGDCICSGCRATS